MNMEMPQGPKRFNRPRCRGLFARLSCAAIALAAVSLLAPPAQANSNLFSVSGGPCGTTWGNSAGGCWQAGTFGVLVGLGQAVGAGNTAILYGTGNGENVTGSGDVGVGAGSKIQLGTSNDTWTGPIDFADGASGTSGKGPYSVNSGTSFTNLSISGATGTLLSQSSVVTALNEVLSLSNYYKNLSGGAGVSITNMGMLTGGQTLGVSTSGTIQVYNVSSINLSTVLTITGGAHDLIIINDPSMAIFGKQGSHAGNVVLSGGLTPDQVLFNLTQSTSNGNVVLSINGATSISADFIVRESWYMTSVTINGRILGGWGTLTMAGTDLINSPGDIAESPEPSTWLLLASALGGLVYFGRRAPLRRHFGMSGRVRERMKSDAEPSTGELQPAAVGTPCGSRGAGAAPSDAGIPPPRDGGGGGSGGVDCARLT
jgi:hypothetical protein